MKTLLTLILLSVFIRSASGQNEMIDLTKGKYFTNKYKDSLKGEWVGNSNKFELNLDIHVEKRRVKKLEVDFTADFVVIRIIKLVSDKRDFTSRFSNPIELFNLDNGPNFSSFYKDPLTKNTIKIFLTYRTDGQIQISAKMPEMEIYNDPSKGMSFPEKAVILKKQ